MIVQSIANLKGGVGKTTLNFLLAHYLAEQRSARVAAVDLDAQTGSLSHALRHHAIGISSLSLFDDTPLELPPISKPVALLHNTPKLVDIDSGNGLKHIRTFAAQIAALEPHFDYCVIDAPPTNCLRAQAALAACHHVTAVIDPDMSARLTMRDMQQIIVHIRRHYNPKLKLTGILVNRVMNNNPDHRRAIQQLFEAYADYMLPCPIANRAAIPRALEQNLPVWKLNPKEGRAAAVEVLRALDAIMAIVNPVTLASATSPA